MIAPAGPLAAHPAYRAALDKAQPLTAVHSDDLANIAQLARAGHGLGLLPDDLGQPGLERLFPLPDVPENSLWVLTHPDLRSLPRVSLLMGYLARALPAALTKT